MKTALRTLIRCLVCGFPEIRSDEVIDRGVVLLHECPRCDHRWTQRGSLDSQAQERLARATRTPSERNAA